MFDMKIDEIKADTGQATIQAMAESAVVQSRNRWIERAHPSNTCGTGTGAMGSGAVLAGLPYLACAK